MRLDGRGAEKARHGSKNDDGELLRKQLERRFSSSRIF